MMNDLEALKYEVDQLKQQIRVREGFIRKKKKSREFSLQGGGSGQNFFNFSTFLFFFKCSNSCKYAKKIFFIGGYKQSVLRNYDISKTQLNQLYVYFRLRSRLSDKIIIIYNPII